MRSPGPLSRPRGAAADWPVGHPSGRRAASGEPIESEDATAAHAPCSRMRVCASSTEGTRTPMGTISEILDSRDLLRNLVNRELKAGYKGSVLGMGWSLVNPLVTTVIFALVFGVILRIDPPVNPRGQSNFAAYLLIGLMPWNYLSLSLTAGASSLVANGNLLRKVYFFRPALPASTVIANGVNFLASLVVLFAFLAFLRFPWYPALWMLPVPMFSLFVLCLGLSLLSSVTNLYFRDTQYLIGLFTQVWFYLTPIVYPISLVEAQIGDWLWLYNLNPATALIDTFRAILYNGEVPMLATVLWSLGTSVAVFVVGWIVFRRAEPHFAEEV